MRKNSAKQDIKIIKTRKYKDISLYLRFSIPFNAKDKAAMTVLSKLIGEVSERYPDKVSMSKAKDMLYGISCICQNKYRTNLLTLSVCYSFINPRFLGDVTIDDYLDYVKETLLHLLIKRKDVEEAKRNLIANFRRSLDKPGNYSYSRVVSIIAQDNEDFAIYDRSEKMISSIKKTKVDDVKRIYGYILDRAMLNVYVAGDVDETILPKLDFLALEDRERCFIDVGKRTYPEKEEIIEKKDIGQSYLSMVYATPYSKKHEDFFAYVLGNIFLGVVPTSLLFEEVREKLSLCYSISVSDNKNEGLVRIHTDIDGKNKDTVIEETRKQIQRLIDKDYDLDKFNMAKMLLVNSISSTYDDIDALVDYYYECYISHFNYTLEQYCQKIMEVSPEDISRVFRNYRHYFTYMLEGTKNGKTL